MMANAGPKGLDTHSELVAALLAKGQVLDAKLFETLQAAGVVAGEPLHSAASALSETMLFLWEVLAQGEGIFRRGADSITNAARERATEDRERRRLTEAETAKVFTEASAEALRQLDRHSDKLATHKSLLRWGRTTVGLAVAAVVIAAVSAGLGAYADRQYAGAEIAEARAQFAAERARDANRESALVRASKIGGDKTAAMWLNLMLWNDPLRAVADCMAAGRIATGADGRRACTVGMWIDPPSVAPTR